MAKLKVETKKRKEITSLPTKVEEVDALVDSIKSLDEVKDLLKLLLKKGIK